jgi:hypothetical protein|tara:strand:- start:22 stop:348 length:327 start_codon:yes stop_codon:yes gene_type:complete
VRGEMLALVRVVAATRPNVTSTAGWRGTNQSIGAWELRCDAGRVARSRGEAPQRLSLPVGTRCRLRAETSYERGYERGHLMVGCWEGFGKRLCTPRGFAEHYRFRVQR